MPDITAIKHSSAQVQVCIMHFQQYTCSALGTILQTMHHGCMWLCLLITDCDPCLPLPCTFESPLCATLLHLLRAKLLATGNHIRADVCFHALTNTSILAHNRYASLRSITHYLPGITPAPLSVNLPQQQWSHPAYHHSNGSPTP